MFRKSKTLFCPIHLGRVNLSITLIAFIFLITFGYAPPCLAFGIRQPFCRFTFAPNIEIADIHFLVCRTRDNIKY